MEITLIISFVALKLKAHPQRLILKYTAAVPCPIYSPSCWECWLMMVLRNSSSGNSSQLKKAARSKVMSLPPGISSNLVTGWGRQRIKAGLLASRHRWLQRASPVPRVPAATAKAVQLLPQLNTAPFTPQMLTLMARTDPPQQLPTHKSLSQSLFLRNSDSWQLFTIILDCRHF